MAFRVSPEDYEQITNLAMLSGMDKQDFIMAKLMDHEIVVRPSTRVYKALKDTMAETTGNFLESAQEAKPAP